MDNLKQRLRQVSRERIPIAAEAAAALDAKDAEIERYRAAIQRALDEAVADDMDEWYADLRAALTGSPR
jgi:hypothetical protein